MKIALLDDDGVQAALVSHVMASAGHACMQVDSPANLLPHLKRDECDLLIAHLHGGAAPVKAIIRSISDKPAHLPVLALAAASDKDSILAALAGGCTDYMIKPVRRAELGTRVEMLLQRAYPDYANRSEQAQLVCGPYRFDTLAASVRMQGRQLELTQKEFELALLLFRHLGHPLSRATIEEAVWRRDSELDDEMPSRTVDTHVSRVRSKLLLGPESGFQLTTVYGYGYCLEQVSR